MIDLLEKSRLSIYEPNVDMTLDEIHINLYGFLFQTMSKRGIRKLLINLSKIHKIPAQIIHDALVELVNYQRDFSNRIDKKWYPILNKVSVSNKNLPIVLYRGILLEFDTNDKYDRELLKNVYEGDYTGLYNRILSRNHATSWSGDMRVAMDFSGHGTSPYFDNEIHLRVLMKTVVQDRDDIIVDLRDYESSNMFNQQEVILIDGYDDFEIIDVQNKSNVSGEYDISKLPPIRRNKTKYIDSSYSPRGTSSKYTKYIYDYLNYDFLGLKSSLVHKFKLMKDDLIEPYLTYIKSHSAFQPTELLYVKNIEKLNVSTFSFLYNLAVVKHTDVKIVYLPGSVRILNSNEFNIKVALWQGKTDSVYIDINVNQVVNDAYLHVFEVSYNSRKMIKVTPIAGKYEKVDGRKIKFNRLYNDIVYYILDLYPPDTVKIKKI